MSSSSFSSSSTFFSSSSSSSSSSSTALISNITRTTPSVKVGDETLLDGNAFGSALALFLFQILFIVTLSRIIYWPLKKIKQPAVIAEMLAGIILGPSALGRIPGFASIMFPTASLNIIRVCSSFGLVVFMFLVGCEMDAQEFQQHFTQVTIISGTGVIVPILLVAPVALLFDSDEFSQTSTFNLILFLGVAMGMSALPVLARILAERNMLSSPIGNLIMGATAIDDVMAWCLLSIVVAIVRSSQQLNILYVILLAIANMICVYFIIRPLLAYLCRHVHSLGDVKPHTFFVIFAVLLTVSWFTEAIGLSALVGAFEVGLMMPRNPILLTSISNKLEDIIVVIIMPLFFTNSGLRTNFFLLTDGRAWGLCILLIAVAMFVKIISIFIPAKLFGLSIRDSLAFGILMSCKGLVALIVVNFGLDYQVITNKLFALLVIMVLVTSLLTVPLTELVLPLRLFKNNTKRYRLQEEAMVDGTNDGKHVELVNDSGTGTGTGLKTRLPISSSDDHLVLRYSHLFGHPLEMNDTTKHLVMVVSNVQKSPGLVSIAAVLSYEKKIYQHDHAHPHDTHPNDKTDEKYTRVLAYRPLLNDDYPSAYIRPSLQSLLIRDEAVQLITERATIHDIHNMGLVAMPVSSDDVIGQLSMLLMASNSEYLLINHTFLQDIDQSTSSFISTPSNPIYRLITTISHTMATIITLIDPIPSISSSPASSQRHLLPNVSRSIHFHIHRIVVPIFPGLHCTRAIAIAMQLEKNGCDIIWMELMSQHGQILPANAHIIKYDAIRSISATTSPEQHILHVHEENEATIASTSSSDISSFPGFSDSTIQNTFLSSLSTFPSSDGSISCILIGDDDHTGTIPSTGSSSTRNVSGSWMTSVDSTMTTWLNKIAEYAPVLIVRAPNSSNNVDQNDVTVSPPTINSLTVVALQAGSR